MNIVVLRGHLSRPPEVRRLPSGADIVSYEVTIEREGARAETVPVVCEGGDAPTDLEPDSGVVVVGRVRRRFFRAGASTQSRTEVVAEAVVPSRLVKRAARLVANAQAALAGEPADEPRRGGDRTGSRVAPGAGAAVVAVPTGVKSAGRDAAPGRPHRTVQVGGSAPAWR